MSFKDYYYSYLALHKNLYTRWSHCVGNIVTLCFVAFVFMSGSSLWWLLLTPFIVYPFAWSGHFLFEKNEPAAFSDPIRAKMADLRMMWDVIRGRLK